MVGTSVIDKNLWNTQRSFRSFNDCENYSTSIGDGYDSGDAIFNGCVYIFKHTSIFLWLIDQNTVMDVVSNMKLPDFAKINATFQQKSIVSSKVLLFLTGRVYKQRRLDFVKNED